MCIYIYTHIHIIYTCGLSGTVVTIVYYLYASLMPFTKLHTTYNLHANCILGAENYHHYTTYCLPYIYTHIRTNSL